MLAAHFPALGAHGRHKPNCAVAMPTGHVEVIWRSSPFAVYTSFI